MKILAVLYCYPPLQFPATMCYVKLVKGLAELGVRVEVLVVDEKSFYFPGLKSPSDMRDESLRGFVPEGIVQHVVWSWEKSPLFRLLREFRVTHSALSPYLEPKKREWVYPALRLLRRLDLSAYDAVLTCSQPHVNHLVGLWLKRRTGIPWIAYFSDPWTDMPWQQHRTARIARVNLDLERDVISAADEVFFTSRETVDLVMGKYPGQWRRKCGILPHGFVPEWYGRGEGGSGAGRPPDAPLRFLHTGHFYGDRSALPLLRAVEALDRSASLAGRAAFQFCGTMDGASEDFVRERGLAKIVNIQPTIPYGESLALMRASDFMLLVDAPLRQLAESVFLPSKLVDYLGSGRPVVGVTPSAGTSARVLSETGNVWRDVGDHEGIVDLLGRLVAGDLRPVPDAGATSAYHYRETAGILHRALRRVAG